MKKIILLPLLIIFVTLSLHESSAVVQVVDWNDNANSQESPPGFNQGTIETGGTTGDTQAGDYVVIACSTTIDVSNSFNSPTPDGWTLLDAGACDQGKGCINAIWGKFTDDPNPEVITCDWTEPRAVFVAGSFRYRDVDVNDPIIDIACNAGSGETAVAPSIFVEPGAQLAGIVTFNLDENIFLEEGSPITYAEFEALAQAFICSMEEDQNVGISGITGTTFSPGPSGEGFFDIGVPADWRACTLAIRMQPTAIPTLSEWGLMAMAGVLGIAGLLVVRRRKAAV